MNFKDKIESSFVGYSNSRNHGFIRSYRFSWKQHVVEVGFETEKLLRYYRVPESICSLFSIFDDLDTFFKKNMENKFKL